MAYIGKRPEDTFRGLASKASFTGDGSTTTFDLSENALDGGTNDIQVFVNNVRQEPGSSKSYTLGADDSNRIRRITFNVAPAASDDIYVISPGRDSNELNTVSDNSITTAKIQDGAITAAKIADGTVVAADIADGSITGAKVNSTCTNLKTPLHFALMLNHEEFVLLLLQNGASLKAKYQDKRTPIEEGLMRKQMTAF